MIPTPSPPPFFLSEKASATSSLDYPVLIYDSTLTVLMSTTDLVLTAIRDAYQQGNPDVGPPQITVGFPDPLTSYGDLLALARRVVGDPTQPNSVRDVLHVLTLLDKQNCLEKIFFLYVEETEPTDQFVATFDTTLVNIERTEWFSPST